MLTTSLDGLWVLQVLTGIEVLAPELGLRPHLPSVETPEMALGHPATTELREAGVIDATGTVDDTVIEWLTVLSRRDVALLLCVQTPACREPERILVARFSQWWVSVERCGDLVRLSAAGTATSEQAAALLISEQIQRLCGPMSPAVLKPATINATEILETVKDAASLRAFLVSKRFDSDQVAILTLAADPKRSAQASLVAIQAGAGRAPTRAHIDSCAVTVIDTPQGRLVSEHVTRGGKTWMIASPGSDANISSAVVSMLRNLPAQEQWYSKRKAV